MCRNMQNINDDFLQIHHFHKEHRFQVIVFSWSKFCLGILSGFWQSSNKKLLQDFGKMNFAIFFFVCLDTNRRIFEKRSLIV